MANVFFQATQDALENITAAFDFVHPLRAGMKYTRRKISEINASNPAADGRIFQSEVDPDQEIHGVDYRSSYIDTPWEQQEEQLAWLLLNNLLAIHEGWIQRLYEERFSAKGYAEKKFVKNLEYPKLASKFLTYYAAGNKKSVTMYNAYFEVYKISSKLDFNKLDTYMLLYRFFKEARNCYMHHSFVASKDIVDAYTNYSQNVAFGDLDAAEAPVIIPPVLGHPVRLSIRGVIGFSQFVRRILIISDAYLIMTTAAEDEFFSKKPTNWPSKTLSTDASRAERQIKKYSNKIGLLKPIWSIEYQNFLIRHKIFNL